jgi:hypothetical protein
MRRIRPRSVYDVLALLSFFLVLGGTTYAATGGNFILGKSNSASTPTSLSSGASQALKVTNTTAHGGVWAAGGSVANNAAAVHGQSTYGNGVEGISGKNTASGVYGQNNSTGFGVAGRSTDGVGVMGDSANGWALRAFGNATQTRTGNGFVKAMAYAVPFQADPIPRCFNSQRPPGQATSGDCGITFTRVDTGKYLLHFNFKVDDRFLSVSMGCSVCTAGVVATGSNDVTVWTRRPMTEDFIDEDFSILVY